MKLCVVYTNYFLKIVNKKPKLTNEKSNSRPNICKRKDRLEKKEIN